MLKLVIKDIMIQKKTFLYAIAYGIFAIIGLSSSFGISGAYMFGGISITYLFILYSNGYDDKSKSEMIFNSLPIKKNDIVLAKYAAAFMFSMIGIIITGIIGVVGATMNIGSLRLMGKYEIIGIIISIGLMSTIYYPLYFKFGLIKLRIINTFLYLIILFVPNYIASYINENPDSSIVRWLQNLVSNNPGWMVQAFGVIMLTILLIISIEISIYVYNKRDL